jgi:purine-cytosine permease-like protein
MNWLLAILGIFGIIGFVISGILYLTAAGNDDQISTAKNAMKYSIIGVIVALLGFVIIQAVNTLLSGNSSNF